MPSDAENLQTRISAIYVELAAGAHSKPSYSIKGRSVSWGEYRLGLLEELQTLLSIQGGIAPYEISVRTD